MRIHYVDDDAADLALMHAAIRSTQGIVLSTSTSIDGLFDRLITDNINCVLLDINRPDTGSLEDDVAAISECCNIPIILVTGAFEVDTHLRATLAGADGVIDKAALSKDLLEHVLINAHARTLARSTEDNVQKLATENTDAELPTEWCLKVQKQLDRVESSLGGSPSPQAVALVNEVRDAVRIANLEVNNNPSVSACVPIRWAINAAIESTCSLAKEREIKVTIEDVQGIFFPKASRDLGYKGLHYLLRGVLCALGPEDIVTLSTNMNHNKTEIVLSLNRQRFVSIDEFFTIQNVHYHDASEANINLRIAAILLGLSRNKVAIGASLNSQILSLAL